jgi:hypothetical protein
MYYKEIFTKKKKEERLIAIYLIRKKRDIIDIIV